VGVPVVASRPLRAGIRRADNYRDRGGVDLRTLSLNNSEFKIQDPFLLVTPGFRRSAHMNKHLDDTSKYLSYVLRHEPQVIGISLDIEGWACIDALIDGSKKFGKTINRELIHQLVNESDKVRFSLSDDGMRIRAAQGHTTSNVAITYPSKKPPKLLYHGTAARFLESILKEGINSGSRHHVHLTEAEHIAFAAGRRYGKAVVLRVESLRMFKQGFVFFQAENSVWLTDQVPTRFLISL
jgi:putative RNA 2'-phosphotransferase